MREVTRHQVSEQRIGQALDGIRRRTFARWHRLRWDDLSVQGLRETSDELLDHVAARTLDDPALTAAEAHTALRTAASCAAGALDLSLWPGGDFEIDFPLIADYPDVMGQLSSGTVHFGGNPPQTPPVSAWVAAFALCLTGSVFEHPFRYGMVLKLDIAPELRKQGAEPAALAEMDALCGYLTDAPPPVRKPDAEERGRAARRLDGAGPLTSDQRLLRVLLDDDRTTFEQALAERLVEYREGVGDAPAPRTLLPLTTIALAKLAVLTHGWRLDVRSGYLPDGLLYSPQQ